MQEIKNILEELYEIEPSLKEKESDILKMIHAFMDIKPNVKISQEFKSELKKTILSNIANMEQKNSRVDIISIIKIISTFLAWGIVTYAVLGINILPNLMQKKPKLEENIIESITPTITEQGKNAFGNLVTLWLDEAPTWEYSQVQEEEQAVNDTQESSSNGSSTAMSQTVNSKVAAPTPTVQQSVTAQTNVWVNFDMPASDTIVSMDSQITSVGESQWAATTTDETNATINTADMSVGDMKYPIGIWWGWMIAPWEPYPAPIEYVPTVFEYSFDASSIPQISWEVDVYKIQKKPLSINTNLLQDANIPTNFLDISKFKNTKIDSISFYEDAPQGYQINYDVANGNVYVSSRYDRWMFDYSQALKKSDMLTFDELSSIANNFITSMGVNISNYGNPILGYDWMEAYNSMESKEYFYFPDTVNLVYPLTLDGKNIYEYGGYPYWLNVSIYQKKKVVTSLGPIQNVNFVKSKYDSETNPESILKYINSHFSQDYGYSQTSKVVKVDLINPTIVFVKKYSTPTSKDSFQTYDEFMVPAIMFEIKDKPQELYQSAIIVPIVKDFYEDSFGYPTPMPMVEPAVSEGSQWMGGENIDTQVIQ